MPRLIASMLSYCRDLLRSLALRNRVAKSLEASPVPPSVYFYCPTSDWSVACVRERERARERQQGGRGGSVQAHVVSLGTSAPSVALSGAIVEKKRPRLVSLCHRMQNTTLGFPCSFCTGGKIKTSCHCMSLAPQLPV